MISKDKIKKWKEELVEPTIKKHAERHAEFTTLSSKPIKRLYTQADIEHLDEEKDLGLPGEFPYTRGIYPTMHRGRLWTMRLFSGFGTAEETNKRYRYLLEHGQNGLSVAFDFPTLMGYDSDSKRSHGEVGLCGVAIDSLADMETLFDGIPLDQVTTSMTINGPAAVLLAMYLALAKKQGVAWDKIGGTVQTDCLKEFIAQHSWAFPPNPSMRVVVDMIEFCAQEVPRFHPISISGYHIREAGSTAVQELAFTLSNGFTYVQACKERGLDVDTVARRFSFFFNAHSDFFEEICKYRAARRIWARVMKEKYGAKKETSLMMRFHTQTAGCSLTAQQPYNNITRTTLQALSAVLGGTQSLHTNALDETLALPTEFSARIALRTQQIIAHESGVTNTIDPLAGSYFVEKLTDEMEEEAMAIINKIEDMGGMLKAIDIGYPQKEIADASFTYQRQIEKKEKIIVGVNDFISEDEGEPDILRIDESVREKQVARIAAMKAKRNQAEVENTLQALKNASINNQNVMPALVDCALAYCTEEEMMSTMKSVFGEYNDPGIF
ncbi:MAG: methylmalonyl-CoA mutase [Deltaproteobacteria bacterium CG_4_10_14_0_2_um_filter_43_8]|nr:MAG: methylmalonyl-CoA mutase [Deltaproteobacteria bacterium CG11_big_fil_rev_8_21_14_0_20_42_23]PJA20830.1 MAG: methylmalonyl-CoA mutase [Deltaproteobacteria bacterium CG_4_10_14_0_2_um_filter_43_8]PJC63964.1 MAG: methylmalonyl-CoA mutase [Deltaproteobacteria bacterium CG_4_9_14_0_2_um_filter_42_21]